MYMYTGWQVLVHKQEILSWLTNYRQRMRLCTTYMHIIWLQSTQLSSSDGLVGTYVYFHCYLFRDGCVECIAICMHVVQSHCMHMHSLPGVCTLSSSDTISCCIDFCQPVQLVHPRLSKLQLPESLFTWTHVHKSLYFFKNEFII